MLGEPDRHVFYIQTLLYSALVELLSHCNWSWYSLENGYKCSCTESVPVHFIRTNSRCKGTDWLTDSLCVCVVGAIVCLQLSVWGFHMLWITWTKVRLSRTTYKVSTSLPQAQAISISLDISWYVLSTIAATMITWSSSFQLTVDEEALMQSHKLFGINFSFCVLVCTSKWSS